MNMSRISIHLNLSKNQKVIFIVKITPFMKLDYLVILEKYQNHPWS